jgi:hypothetical protein
MNRGHVLAAAACLALLAGQAHAIDAKKLKPNQIRISYQEPANPGHREIAKLLKKKQVLEKFRDLLGVIRLPHPLTLQLKGCNGELNAWYDPDEYTVTVCYDLIQKNFDGRPKETTPAGITQDDAFLGPITEIFLHETGHAVFDLLEVPIFGHEEDAADQFAAYIMLKFNAKEARRLIGGIAYMYGQDAKSMQIVDLGQYADEHGHPAQRYYTYLCMAYGEDPKNFSDVLDKGRLPKNRADQCEYEYSQIDYAFKKTITPYVDQTIVKKVKKKAWLQGKVRNQ